MPGKTHTKKSVIAELYIPLRALRDAQKEDSSARRKREICRLPLVIKQKWNSERVCSYR